MDELGKSLPLSEGYIDAEHNAKAPVGDGPRKCLNCGTSLTDKYCPHCGQKDIPKRQTLGELIENFIGSFFSFESKFFKTIKYLLFKPGFLAIEYNSGRRESYYHPARMYVFSSFVYFLLFFSLPENPEERNDTIQNDNIVTSDSISQNGNDFNFSISENDYETREAYDSAQAALPPAERDGWIVRKLNYREIDLSQKYEGRNEDFGTDFGDAFTANAPKVFFLLLPVFALLLKLFYLRRDFYYSEHLAFTTYFYNFFYSVGIVTMLIELIPGMTWFSLVTFVGVNVYLIVAMKRAYQQRWMKTIFKFMLLTFSFGFCIVLGLFANLLITLMQI